MRLLIIEQELSAAGWLAPRLEPLGFRVKTCACVDEALACIRRAPAAAILVDLAKDVSGPQALSSLRLAGLVLPVVLLSARSDWREKVASLDAGADDFIVKPIRSEEIAARLRAISRRRMGLSAERAQIGNFELDHKVRCAWLSGRCLELSRTEFTILRLLLVNANNLVSADEIRKAISYGNKAININAIEVHISRLRKKVGSNSIRTVRGVGYRYIGGVKFDENLPKSIAAGPLIGEGAQVLE